MASSDPRLKSGKRKTLVAALRAQRRGCEMPRCLLPTRVIDYTAPRFAPAAFVADEIIPRWMGGDPLDPTNLRPAHWRCNASAGARTTNAIRRSRRRPEPTQAPRPQPVAPRQWWLPPGQG